MPETDAFAGLFWTNYFPVLLAFTGGVIMFKIRHSMKLHRIEVDNAKEEGQNLASIMSIEECKKCQEASGRRLDAVRALHVTDSKELHGRVTNLSEEFCEMRGAVTEAVRAVRLSVESTDKAARQAQAAAAEAKITAAEARTLTETIKKFNGYGRG